MSDDTEEDYPLKRLAAKLQRPVGGLRVLGTGNDPYQAPLPFRRETAEWFADLYSRLNVQPGSHVRRILYRLVSQESPIPLPTGEPFENTLECWTFLCNASRDARYLDLVPRNAIIDRRNPEPVINLEDEEESPADIAVIDGAVELSGDMSPYYSGPRLQLPSLSLTAPLIPQRCHLEIWCEKSTMNDVLIPLGQRYGVNIVTAIGEMSATACEALVDRARSSGRPVRILYVSDFDPAGVSMPAAAARKIEFWARGNDPEAEIDLDIQVIPVVLTLGQCVQYRLPRTPIKKSESRATKFEARFGEGATELDALEAVHPGELRRILVGHIRRYYDTSLDDKVEEAVDDAEEELRERSVAVRDRHAEQLAAIERERKAIVDQGEIEVAAVWERITERERAFEKKARPLLDAMTEELSDDAPDADDFDWPEPSDGEEHDDPLFDSTRSYVDQVERYHQHQGKSTELQFARDRKVDRVCAQCGNSFTTPPSSIPKAYCSDHCKNAARRSRREVKTYDRVCLGCGKSFTASRSDKLVCGGTCQARLRVRRLKEEAQQAELGTSTNEASS